MFRQIKHSLRQLWSRPGQSILAIAALGIGIGLVVTQFSLIDGILLRGLPFKDSSRLYHIARQNHDGGNLWNMMPVRDFLEFRSQQRFFDDLAAFTSGNMNLSGNGLTPRRYLGVRVTQNTFGMLGVKPAVGRDFRSGEDQPGAPALAILSHAAWQRDFGGAADIVGRTIKLNGETTTVIGVMPQGFVFPNNLEDVWTNLREAPADPQSGFITAVEAMGHLKNGVSISQARAGMAVIARRLAEQWPETNQGLTRMEIDRFPFAYAGTGTRPMLVIMLAMTFFVLLLACANVANLLLARAVRRQRELAIRAALGASRLRLAGQLLHESVTLAGLGAAFGLVISLGGVRLLNLFITQRMSVPFWFDFRINAPVLGFAVLVTGVAGIISGLLPAVRSTRLDLNESLKDDSRGSSSMKLGHFSRWLVSGQVALSCALLVGASLLAREVIALRTIKLTFDPGKLLIGRIELHDQEAPTIADRARFYHVLVNRVSEMPGVTAVSVSSRDLVNPGVSIKFQIEGQAYARQNEMPSTFLEVVSPGYFDSVGLATIKGRLFNNDDTLDHPAVAVINQSFADKYWPDENPLGKRIRRNEDNAPWTTVVGVVPDLYMEGIGGLGGAGSSSAGYYLCQEQMGWGWLNLFVRTQGDPTKSIEPLRRVIAEIDPNQPIHSIGTLSETAIRSLQGLQVVGFMAGIFGVVAALLASLGVYGVTSFAVNQRTREFGIRVALGAQLWRILQLVLRQGFTQLAIGLVAGVGLALVLVRPLEPFLTQVSATNPSTYIAVAALLLISSGLAIWFPARRAAKVDPMQALRDE